MSHKEVESQKENSPMPPNIRKYDPLNRGELIVSPVTKKGIDVYFVPPKIYDDFLDGGTQNYQGKILSIRPEEGSITIFPINTNYNDRENFMKQKYNIVERITIDESHRMWCGVRDAHVTCGQDVFYLLEELPAAFTKDYSYGLGFAKPYISIIDVVEKLEHYTEIVITQRDQTGPDPKSSRFYISSKDFEEIRLSVNRVGSLLQSASRSVRGAETHNILTKSMGIEPIVPSIGRKPIRREFVEEAQGKEIIPSDDHGRFLKIFYDNASDMFKNVPDEIADMKNRIEFIKFQYLIEEYEKMIKEDKSEASWQKFLARYQFILSLAFGSPITMIKDQAYVGGKKIQGDGGKITDYLMMNNLTSNASIIEIKRPNTPIISEAEYRKGVYTPSPEIYKAVSQVIDQRYQFQKDFLSLRHSSESEDGDERYDFESYAVRCCVIAGVMPTGKNQKKSFELFRYSLNNVEIVTYDELLEKLKMLSEFLTNEDLPSD